MLKSVIKFNDILSRLISAAMIFMVKLYRATFSFWLGVECKFTPSCSEYSIEAIKNYGPYKGLVMSIWRIIRCNPLSKGGWDYPDKNE